MRANRIVAALLLVAFAERTASTRADEAARPMARLRYVRETGAELCPDESTLRDAVSARLGYVPFADGAATTVEVRITRRARALDASVRVHAGVGGEPRTRRLSSASTECDQLSSGMALAVSIAIDPLSLTRPAPSVASAVEPAKEPAELAKEPAVTDDPLPPRAKARERQRQRLR